jgi:tetratricopeptide (TPR) repeat protein
MARFEMKKIVFLGFSVLLMVALIFPQEYTGSARIMGYIYDEQGNPIEGVTVKLFSLIAQDGFDVKTDKDGKWVAAGIRGGGWNVDFEMPGYIPEKISIEVKSTRRNPKIEIRLKKAEGLIVAEGITDILKEGDELYDQGKYHEAIQVYENILDQYPNAYVINMNIGNCYFSQQEYDRAIEYYNKVLEKEPENVQMLIAVGNCHSNKGESEEAMEWYDKIELDTIDDHLVLYNIGTMFYNNSKLDMALKYYQRAVEIQKDFLDGLYQLGLTHLSLEKKEQAIQTFENYLKHDPDSERASQVKGFLDYLRKK